jgi:hypothetical protein
MWYIARSVPVNLRHLSERLWQTNHLNKAELLTHDKLVVLLKEKISKVDFIQAKTDIIPFLNNGDKVLLWSTNFFEELLGHLKTITS